MISRCWDSWLHPGGDGASQLGHRRRAVAGQIRHRDIGLAKRDPAVRREAVMGNSAMPLTGVGSGDAQGSHRTAA